MRLSEKCARFLTVPEGREGNACGPARHGPIVAGPRPAPRFGCAFSGKVVTAFNVKLWLPIDNFPVHERARSHRRQMVSKSLQYWGASVQIL